jgi:hypothetical protein
MAFVVPSDFNIVPYNIPNLSAELDTFLPFVIREEKKELRKILGNMLYDAFMEGLEELPDEWEATNDPGYNLDDLVVYQSDIWKSLQNTNLNNIPEEGAFWTLQPKDRWLELRDGADYLYKTKTFRWPGFTGDGGAFVPFIHSKWIADTALNNTGNGRTDSNLENSIKISPARIIAKHYNEYSRLVGNRCELMDTLYGYLYNSTDKYLDVVVSEYTTIQEYLRCMFQDPERKNWIGL